MSTLLQFLLKFCKWVPHLRHSLVNLNGTLEVEVLNAHLGADAYGVADVQTVSQEKFLGLHA
jgi:hypothetical protein